MATLHQGKQAARAGNDGTGPRGAASRQAGRRFAGQEDYTEAHERVFSALTQAQQASGGEGVFLDEIARASGLPREETRALLHDLTAVQHLVTELQGTDTPDTGPRFEAKPRL